MRMTIGFGAQMVWKQPCHPHAVHTFSARPLPPGLLSTHPEPGKPRRETETYQTDQQEPHQRHLPHDGGAGDVSESHRAHGHHEEVHARPVAQVLGVGKVGRVPSVLQLVIEGKRGEGGTECV